MAFRTRFTACLQLGLLLLVVRAGAQVKVGELSSSMSGTIAPGYSASYGNTIGSSHSWAIGGAANLTGSFHSPNFLSYNAGLYLNQSRANSNFQSISNASGVNLTTSIFGGSHFPGSISYSKAYNSEGNYAVPGLANFVTHGNSDTFGVNWSESLPDKPSLSAGYQMGRSNYTVYGTSDQGKNKFRSLNLHSGYVLKGFNLGAFFTNGQSGSDIPKVISGLPSSTTHSNTNAWGANASHVLPLQGTAAVGFNRSSWTSSYITSSTTGSIDILTANAGVHPLNQLSLTASANYSDNLSGQLYQPIIAAGGVVPDLNTTNDKSHSLDLMGVATYAPAPNLQTSVYAERRSQTFLAQDYAVDSLGGSATYMHSLLQGTYNISGSVTENSDERTGSSSLGLSTNGTYSNVILGWHFTGNFGYAQNVQTLLVTYMNSYYNYSGHLRRNWGRFNVGAGAAGSRTGLTQLPDTNSSSQTYNASFGYGRFISANGGYSHASGQALLTGGGLVPVPNPTPLPSNLFSLYGGDSYSVGLSSTPVKKFILGASYAQSKSNTQVNGIASINRNNQFNTLIQYQFRKMYFTSGAARLEQGFSSSGHAPEVVSSYFVGVSRWFNFF